MKIFLDVDGVLADFRQGVCNAFGRPDATATKEWVFWDSWPDVTFEMVNYICAHDFWANLSFTEEGQSIFSAVVSKFGRENIYFLTTPMPNPESYSGKLAWLNKYFPGFEKRTIITMTPKSVFAEPDTLLIDDNSNNVSNFYDAGGDAILVPRMWNALYMKRNNALGHVLKKLGEI